MTDVHDKKTTCLRATHRQRSYNMSMIKGKDTKLARGLEKENLLAEIWRSTSYAKNTK